MFLTVGRLGALGAACNTVSSSTYSKTTTSKWTNVKANAESPYYDATCKCFKEGYKPEPYYILYGLRGMAPAVNEGDPWLVCKPPAATTTTTTCPVCKSCPTCPTCPKCPVCAAAPPCPPSEPCPQCDVCTGAKKAEDSAFGPTLGLLLAVAILGGGGWYAWKKLKKK